MRIILYTGKGGVGKTSVAAATACRLAQEGKRVLIMSTDQAHSLSDSFEVKLQKDPAGICRNLDAMEIDVVAESERTWGNLQSYLKDLLSAKASGGIEIEELLVFPGLEELFALFKILDIYEEGNYDVLIVDCAPTGETLSLLKFPDIFGSFIEKVLPGKRKIVNVAGPAVEKLTKIPMPRDAVFSDAERLIGKLDRLQELMLNKEVLSIRIVTTPEKIVIKEARRNFTCLHLYNYNVDAVIVNKVYPDAALEGYFSRWAVQQQEGIQELKESFREIPLFWIALQKKEIKSLPFLRQVSDFYGEQDPAAVLAQAQIFTVERKEEGAALHIHLPFAKKEEMELTERGGEISVAVKNEKRTFLVPENLRKMEIAGARYEDGVLEIQFL